MPASKNFLPRGPGKNLAIVEPKYTFLSWEAKPQFFIKGPIKKRKGGFCLYSIRLIGLFFCIFFCKFFVFFSFAHIGRDIAQGTKKKKCKGVFFQTPSGHWAIHAQWGNVRMLLPKKKKKGIHLCVKFFPEAIWPICFFMPLQPFPHPGLLWPIWPISQSTPLYQGPKSFQSLPCCQ